MTIALGVIALVVALIGAFALPLDPSASTAKAGKFELVAVLLLALLLGGLAFKFGPPEIGMSVAIFGGLGLVLAYVADQIDRTGRRLTAIAVPLAACAFLGAVDQNREMGQLGLAAGLGLSAWVCSRNSGRSGAMVGAVVSAVVVAADALGARAATFDTNGHLGSGLGVVVLLSILISSFAGKVSLLRGALLVTVLAVGGFLVTSQFAKVEQGWLLFGGGAIAGLIVHLLVSEDETGGSFRALVAAIIWLGVATASFGLGKAQGMAVSAIGGAAILAGLNNTRALLTISPLVAMVFYRWFRELHLDATKAIDIGQHYALIGVAVGAFAPLLPTEWARARLKDAQGAFGGLCWILALCLVPMACAIVLGAKGEIGLAFGFGLAGVIAAVLKNSTLGALSLSAGLSALTVAIYGWLEPLLDLTRQEKVQHFATVAGVLVVLAVAIAVLSRNPDSSEVIST